jgi:RNA polymerase sigma factor (sigma-70 family)
MLLTNEQELIKDCIAGNGKACEDLYHRFAAKMLAVCYRYANNRSDAQDLMQEGFIRVFESLPKFRGEGSFEGWIRRIMVLTALESYRKNTSQRESYGGSIDQLHEGSQPISADDIYSQISFQELIEMIQELSPAYKMVFNLYVFEGMKHEEIAQRLHISVGTSKSNLSDARQILQKRIKKTMLNIR